MSNTQVKVSVLEEFKFSEQKQNVESIEKSQMYQNGKQRLWPALQRKLAGESRDIPAVTHGFSNCTAPLRCLKKCGN